ncbi:uncharacterized protein LOC132565379 [Ylistrum balloti]|uniref:uncharacterized protein LOC132565379 n=1 Tax=Ylistrum balloti TaxID=509963 RepID=UPI002905A74F|nr:uncharacterized protein LOC132565379 [Ylistrum balloti]
MAASMCNVSVLRRQLFSSVQKKSCCHYHLVGRLCSSIAERDDIDHKDKEATFQSRVADEDDYFGVSIPEDRWSVPRSSSLSEKELFEKYQAGRLSENETYNMQFVNLRFGRMRFDNVTDLKHQKDARMKFHDLNQVGVKKDILNTMARINDGRETSYSEESYYASLLDQFKSDSKYREPSVAQDLVSKRSRSRTRKAGNGKVDSLQVSKSGAMDNVETDQDVEGKTSPYHTATPTTVEYGDEKLTVSNEANDESSDRNNGDLNFIDQQYFQGDLVSNEEISTKVKDSDSCDLNFIDQQYFQQDTVLTKAEKSAGLLNFESSQGNHPNEVIPELEPDFLFSHAKKEISSEKNRTFSDQEIISSSVETVSHTYPKDHTEKLHPTSKSKTMKTKENPRAKPEKIKTENFDSEVLSSYQETAISNPDQVSESATPKIQNLETEGGSTKTRSSDINFIDQQFFGEHLSDDDLKTSINSEFWNDQESDLNFIDEKYFKEAESTPERKPIDLLTPDHEGPENKASVRDVKHSGKGKKSKKREKELNRTDMDKRSDRLFQFQVMDDLERDSLIKRKRALSTGKENETENLSSSAYGTVQKLRGSQGINLEGGAPLRDSKGMKVMKTVVPQLHKMTTVEIVNMITRHILYDSDDIVAIYKPYGLPSHGGPGVAISVAQLQEEIGQKLPNKADSLYMVHRLDKDTTGVMLLARTQEMAAKLSQAFREQKVVKKYWAITKGIPNPTEGIIDIPMMEGTVDGKSRMALKLNFLPDGRIATKSSVKTFKAETYYKVKASHENTAIVECLPLTGVRHQLRAHLSFGLNTPILGDHKYSNLLKFAPQKLDNRTLKRLGVQQSKVRYIPLHLHAMSILIPEFLNGRNLFVTSNLPKHFCKSMRYLKLSMRGK